MTSFQSEIEENYRIAGVVVALLLRITVKNEVIYLWMFDRSFRGKSIGKMITERTSRLPKCSQQ
jgi:hypothetical protein